MTAVVTTHAGNNADLLAAVARLYLPKDSNVLDMTYGLGVFWRKINCSHINLFMTDLHTIPPDKNADFFSPKHGMMVKADFCALPYKDECMDIVVFDPPYTHNPGEHVTDNRYRLSRTIKGMYHRDIIELYKLGMKEAGRVLKPEGGQLWIKCKDEVESGVQRWSHIEIYDAALSQGLFARDLFILVPSSQTSHKRWKTQFHARKNHSFLWIMEKPMAKYKKQLERAGIWQ